MTRLLPSTFAPTHPFTSEVLVLSGWDRVLLSEFRSTLPSPDATWTTHEELELVTSSSSSLFLSFSLFVSPPVSRVSEFLDGGSGTADFVPVLLLSDHSGCGRPHWNGPRFLPGTGPKGLKYVRLRGRHWNW